MCEGRGLPLLKSETVRRITYEHKVKMYMVQGKIHDICDLTLIPPAGEDDGWKLDHVEKAILGVINAIDDTHDRYHEKSPALDKARMVMTGLVEFACMCQNHKKKSHRNK